MNAMAKRKRALTAEEQRKLFQEAAKEAGAGGLEA